MLQQVMTEPGKIEFHEVPVPEISDREVLIKIMKISADLISMCIMGNTRLQAIL